VPRGGLQESRIIKGLARGGTLKLLPAFFSFPHHGVPPKRLSTSAIPLRLLRAASAPDLDGLKLKVVTMGPA
jgi:hypothetical protein